MLNNLQLDVMNSCLNVPYIWGGNNPMEGMDCSGYVLWVLRSIGKWNNTDATSQDIYLKFKVTGREVKEGGNISFGALLFFGKSRTAITHIAIAYNETYMYEAGGGGSKCLTPNDAKKLGACVRVRSISNRKDLIAAIFP